MKVLFCHSSFELGGAERRLSQLIIGLSNMKEFEIHCVLFKNVFSYPEVLNTNAKFYYISPNMSRLKILSEFYRIMRTISPDIIHTWSYRFSFYLNIIKPFFHFKYICGTIISANTFKKGSSAYYLERLSFALSDCVVGNSKAGLFAKNVPWRKSHVIYNGFNFERLKNLRTTDEIRNEFKIKTPYVISMASRIEPQKNILMFLQVAQKMQEIRKDVTFLMVGDGSQLSFFKDYVSSKSIQNIIFTGYRNDVESILNASDICVLCSNHKEGVSNSIMEALACGHPVIATYSGGTNEIVLDGKNGYIVNPNDISAMVEKINYLLNNSEIRVEMGCMAKKTVCDKFLLSTMINNYIKLYKSLISE